jgi:PAS domain S-box-containing protein
MDYKLKDLLDIPKIRQILQTFDEVLSIPSAVIDTEGTVLIANSWQDICTKFHRINPETELKCRESDRHIKAELSCDGTPFVYRCPMGLVDSALPIIIEGNHLGNVFTGQLFMEEPDEAYFIEQARRYGFDETEYLAAMRKVPLFPEEKLHKNLSFISALVLMFAEQGLHDKRQRESEALLRESEEKHRAIIQTAIDGFWLVNADGRLVEVNESYCIMSGYSKQELLSMNIRDLEAIENAADTTAHIDKILRRGSDRFETRHRRKDGSLFDVDIRVQYRSAKDGQLVVFLHDITLRKQNQEAVLREKALLRTLIDSVSDLIYFKDSDGFYLGCNKASEAFVGLSEAEQIGKTDFDLINPELAEACRRNDRFVMESGTVVTSEEWVTYPDGRKVFLDTRKAPILGDDGHAIGIVGISRDITERKRLEEERQELEQHFQQSQKLESLGVLAAGIAHNFNNLLSIITGNCYLVKLRPEMAADHITPIEKAAGRAADLCEQMLIYAGKPSLVKTQINLAELVCSMLTMLQSTISQNSVISHDISDDIPWVHGDAAQLRQVVLNLVINSSEAIGEAQGEIDVSLAVNEVIEGEVRLDYLGKPIPSGRYVCLGVSDNGCGMDDDVRKRIFEPFYTTKFTGRGLGMSAVLGIISAHKGALQLHSLPEYGTSVNVYLPVQAEDCMKPEKTTDAGVAHWKGSGTILMVEDEKLIQVVAQEMLTELGFTIIEAANGKQALELYQRHAAEIRLVVSDIGMPVMDGYELFRELKKLNPELPIVISSGFGEATITSRIDRNEIAGFINKPYNFVRMQEVLKGVLKQD